MPLPRLSLECRACKQHRPRPHPPQLLATPLPKIYETDDAAAEALMHPTVATIAGEAFSAEAATKARPPGVFVLPPHARAALASPA